MRGGGFVATILIRLTVHIIYTVPIVSPPHMVILICRNLVASKVEPLSMFT
jgi:hypothetical protein